MNTTTDATAVVAKVGRELLEQLAVQKDQWISSPALAWEIGGDDRQRRSEVYAALKVIAGAGVWTSISVLHNGGPLWAFRVKPQVIRDLLDAVQ
jgi:hypothetical protein